MLAPTFVDTNVLLYARDAAQPAKRRLALEWLGRLWQEQLGRTSVQVLNEYYVNLIRKVKPPVSADDAWEDVQSLFAWDPHSIDSELLTLARQVERRHRLSWWDSLVVAAAQAQGCSILLTEDLHNGASFGPVTVRNPFLFGVEEAQAAYTAPLSVRSRHRPRGRPRKRAA